MTPSPKPIEKRTADTPGTRMVIKRIITECFDDSQLGLSQKSGLDVSAISRLAKGRRPATPEQIGLIVAALPKSWALKLMEAFLSDVAAATKARGFSVRVAKS